MGWPRASGFVVGGLLLLMGGAQALIFGATAVAAALGVPEMIIGLTVVAIGTSLPELFASVMAAVRGESGIAISNVVGSNVFNILFILGGTGAIQPIRVNPQVLQSDTWWMIGFAVLLVLWAGRALPVGRPFAGLLLALSAVYTYTLV
jgi:cation:H+ antiporter